VLKIKTINPSGARDSGEIGLEAKVFGTTSAEIIPALLTMPGSMTGWKYESPKAI
jgi:hypothetical protein